MMKTVFSLGAMAGAALAWDGTLTYNTTWVEQRNNNTESFAGAIASFNLDGPSGETMSNSTGSCTVQFDADMGFVAFYDHFFVQQNSGDRSAYTFYDIKEEQTTNDFSMQVARSWGSDADSIDPSSWSVSCDNSAPTEDLLLSSFPNDPRNPVTNGALRKNGNEHWAINEAFAFDIPGDMPELTFHHPAVNKTSVVGSTVLFQMVDELNAHDLTFTVEWDPETQVPVPSYDWTAMIMV